MINPLDSVIAYVAPQLALRRAGARQLLRAYDGAVIGKRRTGFGERGGSANAGIGLDLSMLRDRASGLVRNNGNAWAMVDVLVRNLVGTGITPVWNTGNDKLDRDVTNLWNDWAAHADAEGELNLGGLQELAVRGMIERGESLVQFVDNRLADDRRMPLRLHVLEGDHVDSTRDGTIDGRRVRLGVALGDRNRRLGYYVYREHPGERIATVSGDFIASDQVRHLYRPLRPGQVRGVSWLAPILMASKDLADLLQFTIVKAQVEASFAGYITSTGAMPSPLATTTDATTGDRTMMPEPGTLYNLKAGQDIKFPSLSAPGQFETVATSVLRTMAAGIGLTYDQATGDLRQANYSSLRAGKIEHRRFVEQVQFNCVIPRICEPVADRFITRAIMAGSLPGKYRNSTAIYSRAWVPPANEPIDPKKDLEADISAVRAGRMAPQEFIAQWGNDWRKVVADSKEFWAAVDKAKLSFDIDPRKPKAGAAAAPALDPDASDDDESDSADPKPDDDAGNT